jgi:hypothetical protein
MPTTYLHLALAHSAVKDVTLADDCRSAFLLGSLAPDANRCKQDKIDSHYSIHIGITWGHRIHAFERDFLHNQGRTEARHWLYRGYRYHLSLDEAWTRAVSHRAMFRLAIGMLTGHREVRDLYRAEQARFDDYHRFTSESSEIQTAYHYLVQADRGLMPGHLDRDKLGTILQSLAERLSQPTASTFQGKIIRLRDTERFMHRVSRITI